MLRENLKDSAEILFNILHQPLEIPDIGYPVSLLEAALSHNELSKEPSDLSKLLMTFSRHPEPTETLIREIDLLARELS